MSTKVLVSIETVCHFFPFQKDLSELALQFGAISSNFYVAFLCFKFGGFCRLFFAYFGFSLTLKGFNIGPEKCFWHTQQSNDAEDYG